MSAPGPTARLFATAFLLAVSALVVAQAAGKPNPKDTEVWVPRARLTLAAQPQ